jgi:hypothetical protein
LGTVQVQVHGGGAGELASGQTPTDDLCFLFFPISFPNFYTRISFC